MCEAKRHTVRLALQVLCSEGIITRAANGRWEISDTDRQSTFDSLEGFIEVVRPEQRHYPVRQLVEFRRRMFIEAVDARMLEGAPIRNAATRALDQLRPLCRAESVLSAEDDLMTELMISGDSVVELFAAQQLRRALIKVRSLVDLDFGLYPNTAAFIELFAAWTAGDRQKTLSLADRIATERMALYVRLAENAGRDLAASDSGRTTH